MAGWDDAIIKEFHEKHGKGVARFGDSLLLLTTKGARTGEERTTPVMQHRDGDRWVVVASMGGAPQHPQWYRNLVANPEVTIEVPGEEATRTIRARAREAQGEERERLWADRVKIAPGFEDYKRKAGRVIPVIVLEPLPES